MLNIDNLFLFTLNTALLLTYIERLKPVLNFQTLPNSDNDIFKMR